MGEEEKPRRYSLRNLEEMNVNDYGGGNWSLGRSTAGKYDRAGGRGGHGELMTLTGARF